MNDPITLSGSEAICMDENLSFGHGKMVIFWDINKSIKSSIVSGFANYGVWTGKGIAAQILQPGKDWQKGTLKLVVSYRVEFIPNEPIETSSSNAVVPSSPLDDLRSNLDIK